MDSVRIEPLSARHDRKAFVSGSEALDLYFMSQASQDVKRRIASCFVAVGDSGETVGYYTLAATGVELSSLPEPMAKKLPKYPVVPAALLGRLAVSKSFQGHGIGGVLLVDALKRVARAELGLFAMVVDAKDEAAERFYTRFGFIPLPGQKRRLCLPLSEALRRLAEGK